MYEERFYRKKMLTDDLIQFNVTEFESDLQILSKTILEYEAKSLIKKYREQIKNYINKEPNFLTSLIPIFPEDNAPQIIKHMCISGYMANVGPMAAVAGAISQYVGLELLKYSDEIILENGGDIFIHTKKDRQILIYAGNSPFSNKISLLIPKEDQPLGICTSSGTVGHSLSFGKADAVVIISNDTLLADAAATAVCNIVKSPQCINAGINFAKSILGVTGVVIIIGDKMGVWGNVQLVKS